MGIHIEIASHAVELETWNSGWHNDICNNEVNA